MKNYFNKNFILILFIGLAVSFIQSCTTAEEDGTEQNSLLKNLGWYGKEDSANIEDDINLSGNSSGSLAAKVDLTDQFPPIGDQGQYGTCVAWATGYNHKSFLEGVDNQKKGKDMTSKDLFSPKYLFWAVPVDAKGSDCNGTGFEYAYDVMVNKGIATMATVPYESLGDCSSQPQSSWDSDAATYKMDNYREIGTDKNTIKEYLSQGRPVSFGAKLGDEFMNYDGTGVLSYQTYGYTGQHAYHAMILAGYDDSKGPNGAFKVINSWGTSWGDNGCIWVDQDFFSSADFCFAAFVATNTRSNPDQDGDNVVDDPTSGSDLLAWELADEPNADKPGEDLERSATYNVFNNGDETIYASDNWNILYIYYNAYDASDYGIIFYDYYTNEYGSPGDEGDLDEIDPNAGDGLTGNWYSYVDVPAGYSAAQAVYGGTDDRYQWDYTMPKITGKYYLVIIADGYDVIREVDENNNYYYLTDAYGDPLEFSNGKMLTNPSKSLVQKSVNKPHKGDVTPFSTVKTKYNRNTYSTAEISKMIAVKKASGEIRNKVNQYVAAGGNGGRKKF